MNPKIKKIKEFWKDFSSNKVAVVSLIVFMLILFVAVFAPLVSPTDPYDLNTVSIMNSRLAPFSEDFSGNYFYLAPTELEEIWFLLYSMVYVLV